MLVGIDILRIPANVYPTFPYIAGPAIVTADRKSNAPLWHFGQSWSNLAIFPSDK
jgi:hypothetical protein